MKETLRESVERMRMEVIEDIEIYKVEQKKLDEDGDFEFEGRIIERMFVLNNVLGRLDEILNKH